MSAPGGAAGLALAHVGLAALVLIGAAVLHPTTGAADAGGDPALATALAEGRPDVVLLGNSMLMDGVHMPLLEELLAGASDEPPRVAAHAVPGTYTAYWYLVLKNTVLAADPPPRLVVLMARDPLLTMPTFRTTGPYAATILDVAGPTEPLLDFVWSAHTAARPGLGEQVLLALRRHVPGYERRDGWRDALFDGVKAAPTRMGVRPAYADAVGDVLPTRAFAAGGTGPKLLAAAADSRTDGPDVTYKNALAIMDASPDSEVFGVDDYYRLDRVLDISLLPEMVRLCSEAGVTLAVLRLKQGPPDWADVIPPDLLATYSTEIDAWFAARDVVLLDTNHDPGLVPELYRSPDHLNQDGRDRLTLQLATWLLAWNGGASEAARPAALGHQFTELVRGDAEQLIRRSTEIWAVPREAIEPVRRHLYRVILPPEIAADGSSDEDLWRSRWVLHEDDRRLEPARVPLPHIATQGGGAWDHRGGELFFSTSDGTSPVENGRRYELRIERLRLLRDG